MLFYFIVNIYYITLLHFALHSYINNILQFLLYTSIFYGNTDKIVDRAGKNKLDFYSLRPFKRVVRMVWAKARISLISWFLVRFIYKGSHLF